MPDELTERIDAAAQRTGKRWQHVVAEMLAHYEMKERDRRRSAARRAEEQGAGGTWG